MHMLLVNHSLEIIHVQGIIHVIISLDVWDNGKILCLSPNIVSHYGWQIGYDRKEKKNQRVIGRYPGEYFWWFSMDKVVISQVCEKKQHTVCLTSPCPCLVFSHSPAHAAALPRDDQGTRGRAVHSVESPQTELPRLGPNTDRDKVEL